MGIYNALFFGDSAAYGSFGVKSGGVETVSRPTPYPAQRLDTAAGSDLDVLADLSAAGTGFLNLLSSDDAVRGLVLPTNPGLARPYTFDEYLAFRTDANAVIVAYGANDMTVNFTEETGLCLSANAVGTLQTRLIAVADKVIAAGKVPVFIGVPDVQVAQAKAYWNTAPRHENYPEDITDTDIIFRSAALAVAAQVVRGTCELKGYIYYDVRSKYPNYATADVIHPTQAYNAAIYDGAGAALAAAI